ncbi:MAG: ATP12 family protein [Alphaproteobacteria bacterium]|nr:ATP12 family protein [Alphaproteobacteria bacterium]
MTFPTHTPAKKEFTLPTEALRQAIEKEWNGQEKYVSAKMPLTSLAYTAIDRIAPQAEAIIEALLVYADTDTLCYRAPEEELAARQKAGWDVVLGWSSLLLGVKWQVVEGIMPLDQPPELHAALRAYLAKQDAFGLAAFSVLAGGFSSLVLAKAVVENHLTAAEAYELSRLEENYSAEKWGRDTEASERSARLKDEMLAAGRFLKLLDAR